MKIAITGGTGFVGSRLVEKLAAADHEMVVFSRDRLKAQQVFPPDRFPTVEIVEYNPKFAGPWQQKLSGCDGVVNLAGAPIADERWTAARKQELQSSRIQGTAQLVAGIAQAAVKPKVLINASAIGYYGTSESARFTETSPAGRDFLASICVGWEREAQKVKVSGVRLVILRLGIVLGNGGAIARMIPPFKLFAGGPIGSGKQWFSWIHREDLVNVILQALENPQMAGIYNATAPNPLRMGEFCRVMGQVMNRPSWLPVPNFLIDALLGDGAIVVLEGQQVIPQGLLDFGFKYQYPQAKEAIAEIV